MFAAPAFTGESHAGLHFVENQQDVILVANLSQRLKPFLAEMMIPAFALNRFDDDRRDVHALLRNDVADLLFRNFFLRRDIFGALRFGQREINERRADARPRELGEVGDLFRVGVRQAHRVAAATVKCTFEVQNLRAAFGRDRRRCSCGLSNPSRP